MNKHIVRTVLNLIKNSIDVICINDPHRSLHLDTFEALTFYLTTYTNLDLSKINLNEIILKIFKKDNFNTLSATHLTRLDDIAYTLSWELRDNTVFSETTEYGAIYRRLRETTDNLTINFLFFNTFICKNSYSIPTDSQFIHLFYVSNCHCFLVYNKHTFTLSLIAKFSPKNIDCTLFHINTNLKELNNLIYDLLYCVSILDKETNPYIVDYTLECIEGVPTYSTIQLSTCGNNRIDFEVKNNKNSIIFIHHNSDYSLSYKAKYYLNNLKDNKFYSITEEGNFVQELNNYVINSIEILLETQLKVFINNLSIFTL
ncbi:MAG: hypothetical protein WBA17_14550 [Saprospiraceae bacterium]